MGAEYVPSIDEYLDIQDVTDDHTQEEYAFIQYDVKARHMNINVSQMSHIYNQTGRCLKWYKVLFDSCSACDIFVNKDFLKDVRRCP